MNIISTLDFLSFIFSAYALITIVIQQNITLSKPEKLSLLLLVVTTSIINFNSFYEWSNNINGPSLQVNFTDFLQILQPAFWGLFYYVFVLSKSQKDLANSYQRMRSIVEHMPILLQAINDKGKIVAWSDEAKRITGYSKKEINNFEKTHNFFKMPGKNHTKFDILSSQKENSMNHLTREIIPVACSNGKNRQIAWHKIPKQHAIPGWSDWGVGFDITHEIEIQNRLQHIATHDALTNLPNLNLLQKHLSTCINKNSSEKTLSALLLIDIDNFKSINDTMGHEQGNDLLVKISRLLIQRVEGINLIFRFGGDEFYILLENISSRKEINIIINNIYTEMAEPFTLANKSKVTIGISMGVSVYPLDSFTPSEMIQHADLAMYAAKENGRSQYQYFSKPLKDIIKRQRDISELLRSALDKNQLKLFYQPQIRSDDHCLIGAEILLRWPQQQGGFISPAEFIPIAERFGLICQIGTWVMEQACSQIKENSNLANLSTIAVNLSAEQFYKKDFVESFIAIAKHYGVATKKIDLEITEGILLNDTKKAIEVMNQLREAGFKLSIDDFGTGYSSLAYLKKFPINKIKIDRAFIQDIDSDPVNQAIVKSVIELGHNLEKEVLAEGIESQEELFFLKQHKCDYIQGYYYSKPICIEEFNNWVDEYLSVNHMKRNNKNF